MSLARQQSEEATLGNLVRQFRSATDCIRELVQNSTDAGSDCVNVWTEFIPGEGHLGTIAIHAEDSGDGMDERIIDEQLTRLFSSSKEGDLTKIGKFGIGFVSVFALAPRGVLVRTGRGGEYWEVFFHEDRTFTKTPLTEPFEGTTVTLFVEGDRPRYRELAAEVLHKLRHWCCHSEIRITFEDRSGELAEKGLVEIQTPLAVSGDLARVITLGHSQVALAYSQSPTYGFFNRGLTLDLRSSPDGLLDGVAGRFQHVAVKLQSPYLEHTLSRDGVIKDDNFKKALALLVTALDEHLIPELIRNVEELAKVPKLGLDELDRYARWLSYLAAEPESVLEAVADRALLRTHGGTASPRALYQAAVITGGLLVAPVSTELVKSIEHDGTPVLYGDAKGAGLGALGQIAWAAARLANATRKAGSLAKLRSWLGDRGEINPVDPAELFAPILYDPEANSEEQKLAEHAHALLAEIGIVFDTVVVCQLASTARVGASDLFFVMTDDKERPIRKLPAHEVQGERSFWRHLRDRTRKIAVNADHPHFRELLALSALQPDMAAYCLARSVMLHFDMEIEKQRDLLHAAHPVLRMAGKDPEPATSEVAR